MKRRTLILLFASAAFAQSQPPIQTPTKSTQTKQNKAASEKAVGRSDGQPAEHSPSRADEANTPPTGGKRETTNTQNSKAAPLDYKGPGVNDWLIVAFTFFLVVLTGFQFWAMHRQA